MSTIKLTECPRDAMQGLHHFVPTHIKAAYINLLLQVGFDTVDFGSFVSPKAIPQMRDTADVLSQLDLSRTNSKLLAIVANLRGAEDAVQFDEITYLGFPFSISETFQQRNTNSGIAQSFQHVKKMNALCRQNNKQLLVYLSMAFGNPYGDEWNAAIVQQWARQMVDEGISIIALGDTTGQSTPEKITAIYPDLLARFPETEFGLHLHSTPATSAAKIKAAYKAGCKRFDSALKGYGGCPMATDTLTGNIATEDVMAFMQSEGINLGLDMEKWREAMAYSAKVF
ncbi:hydroxymethylglutaryl-CoA lyase [Mucilaginibacter paludis]|uniref:Pyruvate carboxyltransferase n=1 Tax=Mucilaginibacter paludis DSM 18603 TaxID=714943 RepID=H1YH91_9SPHI|nr:hydroxymethylglutaryl-CoA lyase [Mucilaginibacter paludis]EHQ24593.1 pyruvate carboxyltransferase [Mucilaginibacter paludis DSM 18603]